jgi:diaminopimelate epimerase
MHGLGNDYIFLDATSEPAIPAIADAPGFGATVRAMSDRHTGVGGDGVILVCPPTPAAKRRGAHARMRMFNADGSESQMCGNGVRCVARFARERLGVTANPLRIQTGAGVLSIALTLRARRFVTASVDMGRPRIGPAACSVRADRLAFKGVKHHFGVERDGAVLIGTFVSMGNPHMVVFEPSDSAEITMSEADLRRIAIDRLGPLFETHPAFAERMNIHFAGLPSRRGRDRDRPADRVVMRTWERGSGVTLACGTGACAVVVAGVITGRLARKVAVRLPGGGLSVEYHQRTGRVTMTGPAEESFTGTWSPS